MARGDQYVLHKMSKGHPQAINLIWGKHKPGEPTKCGWCAMAQCEVRLKNTPLVIKSTRINAAVLTECNSPPWKVAITAPYLPCLRMLRNRSPAPPNKSHLLSRILQFNLFPAKLESQKHFYLLLIHRNKDFIFVRNSSKVETGRSLTGAWTTSWMRSQPTERLMWWWPPIMRRPLNTP